MRQRAVTAVMIGGYLSDGPGTRPAASYNVYRNGTKVNASAVTASSYTDTGLAAGTTYSYTVAAVNSSGSVGAQSAAVNATTTGPPAGPPAPTGLAVTGTTERRPTSARVPAPLPADGNCCLPHLSDLGPVGGTPWLRASLYSAAMIGTRRRSELAGGVALGVVALAGIGLWIGRANPGSTVHPDVLHGTVTLVGGARPVNEFVVDLDGPRALGKGYWLGPVPWTNGAGNGVTEGNTTPPCVAVGHHITFGVVHVPHGGITTDQIVWIDCGGDLGG